MIPLYVALVVGAVLFGVGLYGALSQTNLIMIMMGVEVMLGGAMVNLVAFWRFLHPGAGDSDFASPAHPESAGSM